MANTPVTKKQEEYPDFGMVPNIQEEDEPQVEELDDLPIEHIPEDVLPRDDIQREDPERNDNIGTHMNLRSGGPAEDLPWMFQNPRVSRGSD